MTLTEFETPPPEPDSGLPPDSTPRFGLRRRLALLRDRRFLPVAGTTLTFVLMLGFGQFRYSTDRGDFVDMRLFTNLLADNAYLLVLAIGMTFVILAGGIDLSVGAVVALTGLVVAKLFLVGVPLPIVLLCGVLVGTAIGCLIGVMVRYFGVQPFIASLAGMFLARGLCNVVSVESISIDDKTFGAMAFWRIKVGDGPSSWSINLSIIVALVLLVIAFVVLHYTRFGRSVYGLGAGDGGAAVRLMGLNAGRNLLWVYIINGTCAGIAGILFALYTKSGYNLTGIGMELDAIAAVVIGGAYLLGGSGFVLGSAVGVFVYGLIQVMLAREGLTSWWTKVFIGAVLLGFVILQRAVMLRRRSAPQD